MKIPFLDLKAQNNSIKTEIDKNIKEIIDNSSFILGPSVEMLENEFAKFCNVKYSIGVNSGTAGLHLALLSLGIKQGDEVITVPNTFIATAEAISHCGATPVFCDIDESTFNIDVKLIEEKINDKTKAIIPVHLYGSSCDMDKINEIAKKHDLFVIEDSCQAHGAEYKGRKTGSSSDIAVFSFYPGKNIGAFGEGGIIVTNNKELAEKCKLLRAHGENPKNTHLVIGYNYRMEGIQGAVLNVKLKYLLQWNEARREKAKSYSELLQNIVITPKIPNDNLSVFYLYVIRHKNRDKLKDFLEKNGVATGIHYERPIHLQKAYSHLGYKEGDFPVAEKVMKEILSLPIYPELTLEQIQHICKLIKEFK
jgi:dTDP-4-amino-4,6-dideoxygalactose transaminase